MTLDIDTILKGISILAGLFACTWHLSAKLSSLTTKVSTLTSLFNAHAQTDDARFAEVHGRIDRITEQPHLRVIRD